MSRLLPQGTWMRIFPVFSVPLYKECEVYPYFFSNSAFLTKGDAKMKPAVRDLLHSICLPCGSLSSGFSILGFCDFFFKYDKMCVCLKMYGCVSYMRPFKSLC